MIPLFEEDWFADDAYQRFLAREKRRLEQEEQRLSALDERRRATGGDDAETPERKESS